MSAPKWTPKWNPRYALYAKAHGAKDAAEMLARDEQRFPGGKMGGFMIWIQNAWADWRKLKGYPRDVAKTNEDHAEFDAWLGGEVEAGRRGDAAR